MISLQSHNQVLYYLTQLTLAVNPKSSPLPVKIKRHNDSVSKGIDEISKKSLVEGNKANIQPSLVKLNVYDPSTMCRMKKSNTWIILNQFSLMSCNKCLDKNYRWKVSYISGANFTKNKQSFPCTPLTGPITLPPVYFSSQQHNRTLCTHCIKNLFNYHVQTRSFKTQRNIKMEHERNPTIMSRLKRCLGQSSGSNMNSGFGKDPKSINMEKLKYLFNNSDLPVEEQKRLKLAFVEGYETGVHRQISKRFARWKQVLSLLSGTVLLILILSVGFNAGSLYRFSLSRHAEINPETIQVNFNDVKGVEEAKRELSDVVEFLKNPKKFSALGGKLPKGVLLVGPPGTGKTLLARAVAGEAGVPFFHASGPEFDEILVGQGARRVRDLFKIAKEKAPAVIFIDEIDSVGATRTNSVLHPYANQTINQLLSEMDGFFKNEGVIVLGATNRREDLDKALMRPGRFDVEIYVNKPDYQGRKEILGLYLSKVPTRDVDIEQLTRCTSGFTGADIQNMVNLAALKAARDEECYIGMVHLEYARDKVIMGPEGTAKTNEDVNRVTAYHEAGHALVASYTKDAVPIYKVTIIPRGPSLGHTSFLRETDVDHLTKSELLANIDTMMGGRVAEELIFGPDKVTTGASSDFEKATAIAEQMVKLYGMSEKVGFRTFISSKKREYNANEYAPSTNELIDSEVKRVLEEAYDRAKAILKVHAKELTLLADALLKYETLNAEDVKAIIDGRKTRFET